MRSAYVTLFGGSFRTAQRTDMRKKRSTRVFFITSLFSGRSFRTAQRTDMREKRGGGARVFLAFQYVTIFFFGGPLLERHNAQEVRRELAFFCLFFGVPPHKKAKYDS